MDEATEALARRVRALERQARLQRAAVAALMVAAGGAGLAAGQGGAGEAAPQLEARRFVLVGARGTPLAVLEAGPDAGPRLSLMDGAGTARLSLALAADGAPSIALAEAGGRHRVLLEAGGDEARVSVTGPGKSVAMLANGGIAPRVALSDAAGNDRLWLALRLGSAALQFLDRKGVARSGVTTFNDEAGVAVVSDTDRSSPGLVLYGKDRTIVWSAP